MTNYVIVQNRQTILLGPMPWRQRMFQSEINDLYDQGEIAQKYDILPVENGYVNLGEGIEIFPVADSVTVPEHDPIYEALAGPFWAFWNDPKVAIPNYNVVPVDINLSKGALKNLAAAVRYNKEIRGTTTTVQGTTVTLDTSRDGRTIFTHAHSIMEDGATTNWKFQEGWLTISKEELNAIIMAGAAYIQAQFDWEADISSKIDAATTVEELKAIVIVEPLPVFGPGAI